MSNHTHIIAVPETEEGVARGDWRGPSPLLRNDQPSAEMDRSSVVGAIFLVPNG